MTLAKSRHFPPLKNRKKKKKKKKTYSTFKQWLILCTVVVYYIVARSIEVNPLAVRDSLNIHTHLLHASYVAGCARSLLPTQSGIKKGQKFHQYWQWNSAQVETWSVLTSISQMMLIYCRITNGTWFTAASVLRILANYNAMHSWPLNIAYNLKSCPWAWLQITHHYILTHEYTTTTHDNSWWTSFCIYATLKRLHDAEQWMVSYSMMSSTINRVINRVSFHVQQPACKYVRCHGHNYCKWSICWIINYSKHSEIANLC